jgi:hypothetical protein
MRQDLNKLLCERERFRSRDHYKNYRKLKKFNAKTDEDDSGRPALEGMRIRYGWDRKQFNENLNPLKGILRKAVGSPWDKFYSDLCKTFDMHSVINQHILQHLYDYICVDSVKISDDGETWVCHHLWSRYELLQDSYFLYYVDPRDGIIKTNTNYKTHRQRNREINLQRAEHRRKNNVWIDRKNILHQIEGVWYHYTLEPVPEGRIIYVKPHGKEVFKDRRGRDVSWENLDHLLKVSQGHAEFEGNAAFDLYTEQTVYTNNNRVFARSGDTIRFNNDYYHATKKTASHKTLKKVGLAE